MADLIRRISLPGKMFDATMTALAWSPDGRSLAASFDGAVSMIDGDTFAARNWILRVPSKGISFSPDGALLAGAGDDEISCFDCGSRQGPQRLGKLPFAQAVAWSPDGAFIVGTSKYGAVRLWNLETRSSCNLLHHLGEDEGFYCASFSPDGRSLAAGTHSGVILRWDVPSGEPLGDLRGHDEVVMSLAFTPDGGLLASGSFDSTLRLWDTHTGDALGTLRATGRAARSVIPAIAVSPDGELLASAHPFTTVTLWDVKTRQHRRTLEGHSVGSVGTTGLMAFRPDGQVLAVATGAGVIALCTLSTGNWQRIEFVPAG